MRIIYEGVDITRDISLGSCYYDSYGGDNADSVAITFNNNRTLWDTWGPAPGESIQVEDGAASTGKLYIKDIRPVSGMIRMDASSCPPSGYDRKSRAWEMVTLPQLIRDMAKNNGLTVDFYGVPDVQYAYVTQNDKSDFAFLAERLMLESCSFLVYDGKLVVFNEAQIERTSPLVDVSVSVGADFEYQDNSNSAYGSAVIESGLYTGTFTAPTGANGRVLRKQLSTQVGSGPEANRFAQGLLRSANKGKRAGHIVRDFMPTVAAGSTVNINTQSARSWNGPAYLYHVRHDFVGRKSKLFFRAPLEGY